MLKTTMYDIIMFQQIIFVILTRNTSLYAPYIFVRWPPFEYESIGHEPFTALEQ